jgi:hypothetical protein
MRLVVPGQVADFRHPFPDETAYSFPFDRLAQSSINHEPLDIRFFSFV